MASEHLYKGTNTKMNRKGNKEHELLNNLDFSLEWTSRIAKRPLQCQDPDRPRPPVPLQLFINPSPLSPQSYHRDIKHGVVQGRSHKGRGGGAAGESGVSEGEAAAEGGTRTTVSVSGWRVFTWGFLAATASVTLWTTPSSTVSATSPPTTVSSTTISARPASATVRPDKCPAVSRSSANSSTG